jgi:hypothetical protein
LARAIKSRNEERWLSCINLTSAFTACFPLRQTSRKCGLYVVLESNDE